MVAFGDGLWSGVRVVWSKTIKMIHVVARMFVSFYKQKSCHNTSIMNDIGHLHMHPSDEGGG